MIKRRLQSYDREKQIIGKEKKKKQRNNDIHLKMEKTTIMLEKICQACNLMPRETNHWKGKKRKNKETMTFISKWRKRR